MGKILLDCPFCGRSGPFIMNDPLCYFVECQRCASRGPKSIEMEKAFEGWNRRSSVMARCYKEGHLDIIENLKEALDKIADPRKKDHIEPDAYTELACVMTIANEALLQLMAKEQSRPDNLSDLVLS